MKTKLLLTTIAAVGALSMPLLAQTPAAGDSPATATGTTGSSGATSASATAADKLHYGGQVTAVDATAKTITVHTKKQGDLTFTVSDSAKVTKNDGSALILADIKVGDHAHGAYSKNADGSTSLQTLKIGAPMKKADKQ